MSRIKAFLSHQLSALVAAARLGPLETLLGVVTAIGFSVALEADRDSAWEAWGRLAIAAGLLLPGWLAATMAHHTGRWNGARRWAAHALWAVPVVGYAATSLTLDRELEAFRTILLYVCTWSALFVAPLIARRPDHPLRPWVWRAGWRLGGRIAVVVLFATLLYAGLAAGLASIDALFDAHVPGEAYGHLFGLCFLALAPALVVGGVPEMLDARAEEPLLPRGVRWVIAYLLTPLTVAYVAILYAYHAKLLLTLELPRNVLSPLAMGAAILGMFGMLLLAEAREPEAPPFSMRWFRWFPVGFAPLVIVPMIAVVVRVEQYGWTEPRVMRLAFLAVTFGVCAAGAVRTLRKQPPPLTAVPIAFSAVALLLAIGPLSASSVTFRSQAARLVQALDEGGVIGADGAMNLDATWEAPEGDATALQDRYWHVDTPDAHARWLVRHSGEDRVHALLQLSVDVTVAEALERVGFDGSYHAGATYVEGSLDAGSAPVPGVPAGTWRRVWYPGGMEGTAAEVDASTLRLTSDGATCSFGLDAMADAAREATGDDDASWFTMVVEPADRVVHSDEPGCGAFVVESTQVRLRRSDGEITVTSIGGIWVQP